MKRTLAWFENRLNLRDTVAPMLLHPIPRGAAGPMGWWYVFGSASMTLLMIQILTGIGLALVYVPSTSEAYASLVYLNEQQPLGWFLRSLHYWSGSGMVIMVAVHMTQVFLHGAFKYPRELNWVSGVVLLLLTLGMAFTGQVMRWDADAYWGVGVGASMAGRVPAIGPYLVDLLLGGPIIGSDTLSRFFALHVFVIPGLLLAMLALHLWLVLKRGISAPPVPGQTVDPRTYQESYEKDLHEHGVPFFGEAMLKDALFSALVTIGVILLAAIVGPKGPAHCRNPPWSVRIRSPTGRSCGCLRLLFAQSAVSGNGHHSGNASRVARRAFAGAVHLEPWGASSEPPAGGRLVGDCDGYGAGRAHLLRRDRAVVAGDGCMER